MKEYYKICLVSRKPRSSEDIELGKIHPENNK